MLEDFIHTPIFCCILGGMAVPIVQLIESVNTVKTQIQDIFRFVPFVLSLTMYTVMGAIVGYIFFDGFIPGLKVTYFYTGLTSPLLVNRLIQFRRDTAKNGKPEALTTKTILRQID